MRIWMAGRKLAEPLTDGVSCRVKNGTDLAIAIDAAHLSPGLDARVPLFAVLEDVALEATAT